MTSGKEGDREKPKMEPGEQPVPENSYLAVPELAHIASQIERLVEQNNLLNAEFESLQQRINALLERFRDSPSTDEQPGPSSSRP